MPDFPIAVDPAVIWTYGTRTLTGLTEHAFTSNTIPGGGSLTLTVTWTRALFALGTPTGGPATTDARGFDVSMTEKSCTLTNRSVTSRTGSINAVKVS